MTSATDELSRMLDERGKEHRVWPSGLVIWHDEGSWVYEYSPPKGDDDYWGGILRATLRHCTPEQAIEATLGRGTCEVEAENAKLREQIHWLKQGDILHVLTDQEYIDQCEREHLMQVSIDALDKENAKLRELVRNVMPIVCDGCHERLCEMPKEEHPFVTCSFADRMRELGVGADE